MNQHTTFNMTSLANTSDDFIHRSTPFIWDCFDELYSMLSFTFPRFRLFPNREIRSPPVGDKKLEREYKKDRFGCQQRITLDSAQDFQDASLKGKNQKLFSGQDFGGDHPQVGVAAFSLTPRENFPRLAPRKIYLS
jgi:hypothetical protein